MCGSLLLQVQSQAGDEGSHSCVHEERETPDARLLRGLQCQDVQVGEGLAGKKKGPDFSKAFIYHTAPAQLGKSRFPGLTSQGQCSSPALPFFRSLLKDLLPCWPQPLFIN